MKMTMTLGPGRVAIDLRSGKLQATLATTIHQEVPSTQPHPDFHQTMEVRGICHPMTEVPPSVHMTVASGPFVPKTQAPALGKEEPVMSERPPLLTVASADTVSTAILAPDQLKFKGLYPPFEQRRESADEVGKVLDMYYRPNSSSLLSARGKSGVPYSPLNNTKWT